MNKSRYKNKCGGDLSKAQGANSLEISPPTSHDTDRPAPSNMPKTGLSRPTKRSAGPPRPAELLNSHLPVQINSDMKFSTPNHNAKKGLALHTLS